MTDSKPYNAYDHYVGRRVWTREGDESGEITNVTGCNLGGCSGVRLCVRWPDGKRTRPCSKGCRERGDGTTDLQIM